MKRIATYILAVTAAVLLSSCNKEELSSTSVIADPVYADSEFDRGLEEY